MQSRRRRGLSFPCALYDRVCACMICDCRLVQTGLGRKADLRGFLRGDDQCQHQPVSKLACFFIVPVQDVSMLSDNGDDEEDHVANEGASPHPLTSQAEVDPWSSSPPLPPLKSTTPCWWPVCCWPSSWAPPCRPCWSLATVATRGLHWGQGLRPLCPDPSHCAHWPDSTDCCCWTTAPRTR